VASRESRRRAPRLVLHAQPQPGGGVVVAGAGDIADEDGDAEKTATLLDQIAAAHVITTGDNAYPDGTLAQFDAFYAPTWGRHKARTRPSPGNHEYHTSGAAGYFDYFGSLAGERGKGYYAWDPAPGWRAYALNSNCSQAGGCGAASPQLTWLKADLAANPRSCVLAYWHHPRFTQGNYSDDTSVTPFWDALQAARAELILSGHDHNYQGYPPMLPDGSPSPGGIRQIVVGMGGTNHYGVRPDSRRVTQNDDTYGVIKLTLGDGRYSWEFVPEQGGTFSDSGSSGCH
jgi:acid phosphatase type 7